MNGLPELLEQGRRFAEQHIPPGSLPSQVPAAVIMLATGVVISVLGARLVRPGLTAAFGIAGAIAAGRFAGGVNLPVAATVVVGALAVGALGFALHRLWVGLASSGMLVVVALSVFGYYRILPEVAAFNQSRPVVVAAAGDAGFVLLETSQQSAYSRPSPDKWARDFWTHLTGRQADIEKQLLVIGAAAALIGLLLGVLATRPALIVCTALVGTALVASGLSALSAAWVPGYYQSAVDSPGLLAAAAAGLLGSSLLLQALLNRRPPPRPATAPAR